MSMENRVPFQIAPEQDASGNKIKVILSSMETVLIVYTALVDAPNLWDDEFAEAFVYYPGAHLAGSLVGDKQIDKEMVEKASMLAAQARAVDANEQPVSPNHTPDWIRARGGVPVAGMFPYPMDNDDASC
ncbi:MAG: hypothetical protein P4L55_15925 [Syntrophobacteraceae bacterium]|nr:hypothetical protein [Syntrophobacteraceae bacterium]